MDISQKKTFLSIEGDNWYTRTNENIHNYNDKNKNDIVLDKIKNLNLNPKNILEIGCSSGTRLNKLYCEYKASCHGIDPSTKAINEGKNLFENINLQVGTADKLDYKDEYFDMVIIGFCLYVCDRKDLFKIASEIDRVLINNGIVIILDFISDIPYKNKYKYIDNMFSYKYDNSNMFLWNPCYKLLNREIISHDLTYNFDNFDDMCVVDIIKKYDFNLIYNTKI